MRYRRLGRSGLQVSELYLGSWVTYGNYEIDFCLCRTTASSELERKACYDGYF
jgi:aryl-alcohol dehydrogenase-like predicted oxidoreductase